MPRPSCFGHYDDEFFVWDSECEVCPHACDCEESQYEDSDEEVIEEK